MAAKFTLVSYSSPTWADAAHTAINADVIFKETGAAAIPFTASKNDPEPHGADLFNAIVAAAATTPIAAYVAPTLTIAQRAQSLINAGLTITSTGTPALNGTYTVASGAPFGREDIQTEAQFVSTFGEFTNGTTTLQWPLIDGTTMVKFPTTAAFLGFAKAAGQFYAAAMSVARAGTGTLPAATATIP